MAVQSLFRLAATSDAVRHHRGMFHRVDAGASAVGMSAWSFFVAGDNFPTWMQESIGPQGMWRGYQGVCGDSEQFIDLVLVTSRRRTALVLCLQVHDLASEHSASFFCGHEAGSWTAGE